MRENILISEVASKFELLSHCSPFLSSLKLRGQFYYVSLFDFLSVGCSQNYFSWTVF